MIFLMIGLLIAFRVEGKGKDPGQKKKI